MAWEARSGLKLLSLSANRNPTLSRNGLGSPFGIETMAIFPIDHALLLPCRNGLGSPFGIETYRPSCLQQKRECRNGLGSPFGIETSSCGNRKAENQRRNGLGSPFGIETWGLETSSQNAEEESEWPGKPVRD